MVKSGNDYREANRKRVHRFYDKAREAGKRRITAMVDGEAYALLMDAKKRGMTMSGAVEQAIKGAYGKAKKPEADDATVERAKKLLEIKEQYPGPKNAQKRVEVLNASDITLGGVIGKWDTTNARNAFLNAKKTIEKHGGV